MPQKRKAAAVSQDNAPVSIAQVEADSAASAAKKSKTAASASAASASAASASVVPREVLSFGSNECLQLGLGEDVPDRKKPSLIKSFAGQDIISLVAGGLHNAAITSQHQLWTWGCNDEKALGRQGPEWQPAPVSALSHKQIVQAACGDSHSLCLASDGMVYSWGTYRDLAGILGFSKGVNSAIQPQPLTSLLGQKVIQIAAGENHDLALTADGTVYEWGNTRLGTRISDRHKQNRLQPATVRFPSRKIKVVKIFAAGATSFALTADDKVYAWGLNNYGQVGLDKKVHGEKIVVPTLIPGLSDQGVEHIAGGIFHILALLKDGTVLSCGAGIYGQLGHGNKDDLCVPTPIAGLQFPGDRIIKVACGAQHSLAVTSKGHVYTWGFGEMLQLGTGEHEDELTPTLVEGSQLETRDVLDACAGGQHTLLLAKSNAAQQ